MGSFSVVIAGGGVAALEGLLRLRKLAGERVDVTVLAPGEDFAYRALSVREPFSLGGATRYPLGPILDEAGATWVRETLRSVELERGILHTGGGTEMEFDALLVAVGARPQPAFEHAKTFDDAHSDELFRGVVQDVEDGYVKKLAFVNPTGPAWPLPLYELALMTARSGRDAGWDDLEVSLVTAEKDPMPAFGPKVGAAVRELLSEAGIRLYTGAEPDMPEPRRLVLRSEGIELQADRVIATPRLTGPSVGGIPGTGRHGFIPIDRHCVVPQTGARVFAAGDACDFPLKHGGVGAQAADVAAASIARKAGVGVEVPPFHPVVHGKLLTGAKPKYLFARYIGQEGFDSVVTDQPSTESDAKVTSLELAPYLERLSGHV